MDRTETFSLASHPGAGPKHRQKCPCSASRRGLLISQPSALYRVLSPLVSTLAVPADGLSLASDTGRFGSRSSKFWAKLSSRHAFQLLAA
jgi:hypothetical protein